MLSNPMLAIVLVPLVLSSPLLAVYGGTHMGAALVPAESGGFNIFVEQTVAFLTLTGALVGAAVTSFLPSVASIGPQLEAAPISRARQVLYVAVVPLAALALAMTSLALCFLVPFTVGWPVRVSAVLLVVVVCLAAAASALLLEGVIALARKSWTSVGYAAVGGATWLGVGMMSDQPALLGPSGLLVRALVGEQAAVFTAISAVLLPVIFLLWMLATARRPPETEASGRLGRSRIPARSHAILAVSTTATLKVLRSREVIRHLAATCALVCVSVVLFGRQGPGGEAVGAVLGLVTATFGVAMIPLSAGSFYRAAAWFWRSCGISGMRLAAAYVSGAVLLAIFLMSLIVSAVYAATSIPGDQSVQLWASALVTFAVASLAGALVPWSKSSTGSQVAAYGTLLLAMAGIQVGLSRVNGSFGLRLEDVGAGSILLVVTLVLLSGLAASAVLARSGDAGL